MVMKLVLPMMVMVMAMMVMMVMMMTMMMVHHESEGDNHKNGDADEHAIVGRLRIMTATINNRAAKQQGPP